MIKKAPNRPIYKKLTEYYDDYALVVRNEPISEDSKPRSHHGLFEYATGGKGRQDFITFEQDEDEWDPYDSTHHSSGDKPTPHMLRQEIPAEIVEPKVPIQTAITGYFLRSTYNL